MSTVAQLVIDGFRAAGIRQLFVLPGVQNDDFFNVLFDARHDFDIVVSRHEQGAAYLAAGAAQATGRPTGMVVVPGPGMLNASAGLLSAYTANAPVLALIGQIPTAAMGRGFGVLHELPDQTAILRQVTKHATCITDASSAVAQVQGAIDALLSGAPRPVSIEVPVDVWMKPTSGALHPPVATMPSASASELDRAVALLAAAERPLLWVGGGAQGASASVRELAEVLQCAVGTRRMGHGVVDGAGPYFAPLGLAHRYWADADVVVGIGSRMEWPLGDWGTKGLQLVHVNVDADEINRRGATTVGLCGDAAAIVPALVEGLRASGAVRPDRTAQLAAAKAEFLTTLAHLEPQRSYLAAIHDALPADGVMVEDVTQVTFAAHLLYPFSQPRTFLSTGVSGTLGSGLALAIGAQRALPSRQVLAVCGDGGFLFTATELATAVQHDIPVTAIVFDDGAYGNVKLFQTTRFGADRTIASDLVNPDFVAFARSFGAWAERAESPDELRTVLARALAHDGPALVHVPVGPMASAWPHLRLGPARLPEPSST